MRYLLKLNFDGTHYHGWQVQPNAVTVQGVLNEVLSRIFEAPIETMGCGRTDTGVHARTFYAHFDCNEELSRKFITRANSLLPPDIRVLEIHGVTDDFNARFDAISRSYEYVVHFSPDPFLYKYALMLYKKPDFNAMNRAAKKLEDYSLFTSFSKSGADNKTDICKITEAEWREHGNGLWKFHITSDRFLRGMVRAIVGTLLEVGNENISEGDFIHIIESVDRTKAGESVAAHGLFLCNVIYSKDKFI